MGIISRTQIKETCRPFPWLFWLWPQLPLPPLNMAIATTFLVTRNPYKSHNTKDAKSFGKKSTKLDTKKSRRKNATMSPTKYLFKIPKLSVKLDMKRNAKTNGSVLIIPNKKTLITAKTKNGNQPTKDARAFM